MRGPPSKCKSHSHFFKFIPPGHMFKLAIPKSFRKYLIGENKIAILKRGNEKWAVKIGDDWVFGDGWGDFVRENGVQEFDFVVFKHEGNMVFDTMVFDPSCCERKYPIDQVTKKKARGVCSESKSLRKCKIDTYSLKKIPKGKETYPKISLLKADKTMNPDQTRHPYFVGTLKQYATAQQCLYIPKNFALENGLSNGKMIFKNMESEGSWTVKLRSHFDKKFYVQRGLHDFCTAIGLQIGDHFRFELIQRGKKPIALISRLPKPATLNPYFRSTATAYSIYRATVNIPLSFARANGLDERKCEMVMIDEKQRLWPTKLCKPGDHICIRELRDMFVANGLKESDEFLIELVDNGNKPLMNFHKC